MPDKIQREEYIDNKVHPASDTDKTKMRAAITEFRDRIAAKYLTD